MIPEKILNMIQQVYQYYSIGSPAIQKSYPGYAKIKPIVHDKIVKIQKSEATPWASFVNNILEHFKKYNILDKGYQQFPSYSITMDLENFETEQSKTVRSVNVVISLLTNYYTVFFDDRISYNFDSEYRTVDFPPVIQIIYFEKYGKNKYENIVTQLGDFIKKYFPSHSYVSHKDLLDYKFDSGIYYGTEIAGNYSLFEYLFSNELVFSQLTILE